MGYWEIPSLKRELIHNGQSEGLKKLKEQGPSPSFSPCGGRRAQWNGAAKGQVSTLEEMVSNSQGFSKMGLSPNFPSHGPGLSAKRDDWGSPMT